MTFSFAARNLICLVALLASAQAGARLGGNTSGGGGPDTVDAGALRLLIEGGGLKRAMVHYVETLPLTRVEDGVVRTKLAAMMANDALLQDIQNSRYVPSKPGAACKDAFNHEVPAATQVGSRGSDVCFDIAKLVPYYRRLKSEDVMVKLASLAFHEHTHHFQTYAPSSASIARNEDEANRVGGYILITAKFEQLPILRWTAPASGAQQMREMESLWSEVHAREAELMAPSDADYAAYPGSRGQSDRGVIRLFPRDAYGDKMVTSGGGAYFDFVSLNHAYGNGSDIQLEQGELSTGFAGCDFGFFVKLAPADLDKIDLDLPALRYLNDYVVADGEPAIRKQQSAALYAQTDANGFAYNSRVSDLKLGDTFAIRSIKFSNHDVLVAFKVIRIDENGIVSLAWKRLKSFPAKDCR